MVSVGKSWFGSGTLFSDFTWLAATTRPSDTPASIIMKVRLNLKINSQQPTTPLSSHGFSIHRGILDVESLEHRFGIAVGTFANRLEGCREKGC